MFNAFVLPLLELNSNIQAIKSEIDGISYTIAVAAAAAAAAENDRET